MTSIDEVIDKYITTRDWIKQQNDAHKARMQPYEEGLTKLETWLLQQAEVQGVESFKTSAGTAYKTLKKNIKILNWEEALQFILTNGVYHLLTKGLVKTEVLDFMQENKALPPGVELEQHYEMNVNRPRGSK